MIKTLTIAFVALLISLPFAFWGLAYEFSYFKILGLNVFNNFNYIHYVFSGGIWVLTILVSLILVISIIKFFSSKIEKNDWDAVKESLNNTQFSNVIGQARAGFVLSIIYLISIIYVPSSYWFINALGEMHLFVTWNIFLLFFASIWLSPQHSKFAVIIIFIISIGACFSAGGVADARANIKLQHIVLRDDYLVTINKTAFEKYAAKPKALKLHIPLPFRKLLEFE